MATEHGLDIDKPDANIRCSAGGPPSVSGALCCFRYHRDAF